jgi:hypothetical protein
MPRTIRRKRRSGAVDKAAFTIGELRMMGELRIMEVPMGLRTTTTHSSSTPFG